MHGIRLHDLEVDLLHINLLIELGRKLGALEELGIHAGRHVALFVLRNRSVVQFGG